MTTEPLSPAPSAPRTRPRMFGQPDYVLPDAVHTNLPRQGYEGQPRGWHHARGLLMELCRELTATPVALYHQGLETANGNPDGVVVTAIAQDRHNRIVTVVWRQQHTRQGRFRKAWQLTVNGVTPPRGRGSLPPAAPWLARIAATTADR